MALSNSTLSKQDLQGARTAADIERKYNFGKRFGEVFELLDQADKNVSETVCSVDVEYYLSTSTEAAIGGEWSTVAPVWVDGMYMWSRTKTTLKNGSISYSPSANGGCIAGATGASGSTGATGTGVASITEEYYLSTSKETPTGGAWSETPPTWNEGNYIWTRSKIVYKNPDSTEYTTPVCDTAWEAVNELNQKLDAEEVFNRLTDNGTDQGIYREDGRIYINAEYIKSGKIKTEQLDVESVIGQSGGAATTLYELEMVILPVLKSMPQCGIKFFSTIVGLVHNLGTVNGWTGDANIIIYKNKMMANGISGSVFVVMSESGHVVNATCHAESEDGNWSFDWFDVPKEKIDWDNGCARRYFGGIAEWINPPMFAGVKYRTTERWMGNPVFRKLIDFGSLPNASTKYVAHDLTVSYKNVCGLRVIASSNYETVELPMGYSNAFAGYAYCNADSIAIRTQADLSSYTAIVELKWYE